MKEADIKAKILRIIVDNPGITDYAILSKLSKDSDYEYTNQFHSMLYDVSMEHDIRISKNKYYPRRSIQVVMKVEGRFPPTTCLQCECCKDIKDVKAFGIDRDTEDREHICALDVKLRFVARMGYVPAECPILQSLYTKSGDTSE